jgi:hypothetical protein
MARPAVTSRQARAIHVMLLGGVVGLAMLLAFHLRRAGHTEGDDFALYLRQARSLFDGDTAGVVADNRFTVLNSDPGFSPIAYPWGWPLLLAPFVHLWSFDYDRLKLVEIAAFAIWLVLFHGIVRRRLGSVVALGLTATIATAPAYLGHTDQLLAEFPHMAMVAAVIWWHDRIRARSSLIAAAPRDLVVLGLLVVVAFNIRRESVLLLGVIACMQLLDVWRCSDRRRMAGFVSHVGRCWKSLAMPVGTFVVGAAVFHLLLPTDLLPDNGNDVGFIDDRWRDAPRILSDQLGLGERPALGAALLVLALAGAVVGVRRRPLLDTPLLLVGLLTAVVIGTHFRRIDRYWLQVTPWVLYFVASALLALAQLVVLRGAAGLGPERRRTALLASTVAVAPLVALVIVHLVVLPGDVAETRDANAAGVIQDGPAHPLAVAMFDAVEEVSAPDAVIAFYRARTMTLLTDRRAIQSREIERIGRDADLWVQRRDWSFWQPDVDLATAREVGFTEVWSNDRYVIWQTGRAD